MIVPAYVIRRLAAVLPTLLVIAALVAGNALALVAYSASYTVQESNGDAYTMIAVSRAVPNMSLAASGFMRADALDTRVETSGGLEYPHMVSADRTAAALPLPANSQANLFYTTGNSTTSSFQVVPGYEGLILVPDDGTLEVANNFAIASDGWVNVAAGDIGSTIVFKRDAFISYVSAAATVSSSILGTATATNPTGNSDPGVIWAEEALAYDNNNGTGADINVNVANGTWSDYIVFTIAATWAESVDFYANTAAVFTRAEVSVEYGGSWYVVYSAAFTNLTTTTVNLYPGHVRALTGMRMRFYNSTGAPAMENDVLREVNFNALNQTLTANAAALTSSEMLIETIADTTDLKIFVDGVQAATIGLAGASIPNNGYHWLVGGSAATPYWNSFMVEAG